MYIIKEDLDILCSNEIRCKKKEYHNRFDEIFPPFNYDDFCGTEAVRSIDVYLNALETALKTGKPYRKDKKER